MDKKEKPKIEAYWINDKIMLFKHSKECQCEICINKWVEGDRIE